MAELEKKYWNIALILSLAIHTTAFITISGIIANKSIVNKNKKNREIEIITSPIRNLKMPRRNNKMSKSLALGKLPPPYLDNLIKKVFVDSNRPITLDKPQMLKQNFKNIVFSGLPKQKKLKKNPAYMNYYRIIREKIRANAYRYYGSKEEGQVFLTFIISNDGKLQRLYLDNNPGTAKKLVQISLKSITDAAPFPHFPPQLNYTKLQFNISIYFKNN